MTLYGQLIVWIIKYRLLKFLFLQNIKVPNQGIGSLVKVKMVDRSWELNNSNAEDDFLILTYVEGLRTIFLTSYSIVVWHCVTWNTSIAELYITTLVAYKFTLVVCGNIIIFPRSSYVQFVLWHSRLALICLS